MTMIFCLQKFYTENKNREELKSLNLSINRLTFQKFKMLKKIQLKLIKMKIKIF